MPYFVIADLLVDKPCRPQKPLLIYATLYIEVVWVYVIFYYSTVLQPM